MNEKMIKNLSSMLSKMPKKELNENLSKAKEILKTKDKEALKKLLDNEKVAKLVGQDTSKLKNAIDKLNFDKINTQELDKQIANFEKNTGGDNRGINRTRK